MTSLVVTGRSAAKWVRKLHVEEEGMETLQIVMILAVAAMVLTGVNKIGGIGGASGGDGKSGLFGLVTQGIGSLFGSKGGSLLDGIAGGLSGIFG